MKPAFGPGWRPSRPEAASRPLEDRADELRSALRLRDPGRVAACSGARFRELDRGRGELEIPFWEQSCRLTWPELIPADGDGRIPAFHLTLLLYYLSTADGTPLSDTWVSFADLPDGRVYQSAFQGYSGDELVRAFGPDLEAFGRACRSAGGRPSAAGDASFVFAALPRLPLMAVYWRGEEEFPSSCKILFDGSAGHYLPVDGCALLGSGLVRRLLHA